MLFSAKPRKRADLIESMAPCHNAQVMGDGAQSGIEPSMPDCSGSKVRGLHNSIFKEKSTGFSSHLHLNFSICVIKFYMIKKVKFNCIDDPLENTINPVSSN